MVAARSVEKLRLQEAIDETIAACIRETIVFLDNRIALIEAAIHEAVKADAQMMEDKRLLALMPELGRISPKKSPPSPDWRPSTTTAA